MASWTDPSFTPWPGRPHPLGATWDGNGTGFAVFSSGAEEVDLCLFDRDGVERRLPLTETTHDVWHGYVPGVPPGTRYGFRADGPYEPHRGLRFNAAKLLADPYARAFAGEFRLDDALFGYHRGRGDDHSDHRDNAPFVPLGVVVDGAYDWGDDRPPRVPWPDTVIYEAHVRGLTMRHPDVPPQLRGTFAGLAHQAVVEHLVQLGVTTVELLPVHQFVSEVALLRRGLVNYWGYSTLGFFAPHAAYAADPDDPVREFKDMVRTLHAAGIEVVLDVVYNHTAEGDRAGPTLSWRGLDNAAYYRLAHDDPREYVDDTGCGNTLNARSDRALQLVMDSLRYWVTEMHVDGFRFDLAVTLARGDGGFRTDAPFFQMVLQDPVLANVKLVAEPWDLGPGGYQIGRFPPQWTEWNSRYRDTARDFWRGAEPGVAELASRLAGSSDLYARASRRPYASLNFITAHDGFTLHDLVRYEHKHNEANGEDNRDGTGDNRSWNGGIEGETEDADLEAVRRRQQRNLLATLFVSLGVPMLTAGDELSRTQHGNNNAYCQDNEISWLDWSADEHRANLLAWTRRLARLRRENVVFRRRAFLLGRQVHGLGAKDVGWFTPSGAEMTEQDWAGEHVSTLGVFFDGDEIPERGPSGERLRGDSYLVVLHAGAADETFRLPGPPWADTYEVVADTADEVPPDEPGWRRFVGHDEVPLTARSVVVLRAMRA